MMEEENEPMILVVDDTETFIDIVLDTLGDQYQFCVCTNGETALETAASEQPDLILLDILMPEMDGYEVCKRLKDNPATKSIPVIFLTVKTDVEDERKGFDLGAVDYITKPISPPILEARVKTHLEIRENRLALEAQNKALMESAQLHEDVENITRHDLKNPLAAVIGSAQLLLMRNEMSPSQKKLLQNIECAGYSILEMINSSLNLYKMEQGTYTYHPASVDIHQLINRVVSDFESQVQLAQQSIIVSCVDGSIIDEGFVVQAEELLSYSMLSNLIKNALEAAPYGSSITILMGEKDGLFVSIQNEGVVPLEIREQFFDKYITMGKEGGTGLGAYSAKLIAETQGGSIRLETVDEKCTRITVVFSERA